MKFRESTDPFVYMCVASGNPDAVVIIHWIQAELQNGRLLTEQKSALLWLDVGDKNTPILTSWVELGEIFIDS